jgi:hypothetical protein
MSRTHPDGRARAALVLAIALAAGVLAVAAPIVAGGQKSDLDTVRAATARFHSLTQAKQAGYELFYECTDHEGLGAAMGQHFVKGSLVGDGVLDLRTPEVLVYEPKKNGGYELVAVEYVEIAAVWDGANANAPRLFGRSLAKIPAGNRYGLPDFYEIHAWAWRANPRGTFDDWNPTVTCRGNGDAA